MSFFVEIFLHFFTTHWGIKVCLPSRGQYRVTFSGIRRPSLCLQYTSAICCRQCLLLALDRAEMASFPLISHLGGWSYVTSAVAAVACFLWGC